MYIIYIGEIFPNVYQTCLHLPTPPSSLLVNAETTFTMAHTTRSTGNAMVQTEWRSVTGSVVLVTHGCKARFVFHDQRVKNSPLQSTRPWRPASRTHSTQSQGSTEDV